MLTYMNSVWALSISLAATEEVEVSFLSWGYLDVSVHPVRPLALCIQTRVTSFSRSGFPIQKSPDQSLLSNSPELIAAMPRLSSLLDAKHPPYTLCSLTAIIPEQPVNPPRPGDREDPKILELTAQRFRTSIENATALQ